MSVRQHLTELEDGAIRETTPFVFGGVSDYWLVPDGAGANVLRGHAPFAALRPTADGWRITWIDEEPDPVDAPRWQDALKTRLLEL